MMKGKRLGGEAERKERANPGMQWLQGLSFTLNSHTDNEIPSFRKVTEMV